MNSYLAVLVNVVLSLKLVYQTDNRVADRLRAVRREQTVVLRGDGGKVALEHALDPALEYVVVEIGKVLLNQRQVDVGHAVNRTCGLG